MGKEYDANFWGKFRNIPKPQTIDDRVAMQRSLDVKSRLMKQDLVLQQCSRMMEGVLASIDKVYRVNDNRERKQDVGKINNDSFPWKGFIICCFLAAMIQCCVNCELEETQVVENSTGSLFDGDKRMGGENTVWCDNGAGGTFSYTCDFR